MPKYARAVRFHQNRMECRLPNGCRMCLRTTYQFRLSLGMPWSKNRHRPRVLDPLDLVDCARCETSEGPSRIVAIHSLPAVAMYLSLIPALFRRGRLETSLHENIDHCSQYPKEPQSRNVQ